MTRHPFRFRSSEALVCVVALLGCPVPRGATAEQDAVRSAIEKGLRRLDKGAASYVQKRQCFSCHHQATTISALTSASRRGFKPDAARLPEQVKFTLNSFLPRKERILKGEGIPGGNTMAAYALFALENAGHKPDETTSLLVEYLLIRQAADGSWPALMPRPPSEGSSFTNAALALRALKTYGPKPDDPKAAALRTRVDRAFAKGRSWLLSHQPKDTEDRMFHLRALVSAGAQAKAIDTARDELLKAQHDDGSWSQLPELKGDAYATGGVLTALRAAGLSPRHAAYQKGVKFLVSTQKDDGSWFVPTRSRPVQVFFDNGDPHGKSQFISFAGTGWAVLALLETIPES